MTSRIKPIFTIREMSMVAVLTALGFAANYLQILIPTPLGATRFHLGNVICLLSGFLLGPVLGGLSGGIGAMLYDFTNPLFANEAGITFLMKFALAFLCGKIAWSRGAEGKKSRRNIAAAAIASLFYILLFLSKNLIMYVVFQRMELTPALITLAQQGGISLINAALSVGISVPLNAALQAALARAGVGIRSRK